MYETIDYFQHENQQDLNQVNKIIQEQVLSDVVLINQIGNYIITSGGKRLRPITVILAGKVLGSENNMLYRQAAMIEFIHTSTLLHDDVVDESDLRRGKETANRVFGNAAAVLVGDFLYTRAFQLMVSANNMKLMKVMSDATNIIATGEVMQLINIGNTAITKDEYLQVIENKTAKLFEAAAQIGGILGNANPKEEEALKNYGRYMGLIFQIVDDILDYSGNVETIGKNVGDDLTEGKPTLPLIYLLHHGSDKEKKSVIHALENADSSNFEEIHQYITQSSALQY
ncbi:MAG: polyprenyl synthetase family protein, partial [Neisseriaceae bacterium]|nr:polyprenyl synthetase family protein [Neisseriaceae bacterium]